VRFPLAGVLGAMRLFGSDENTVAGAQVMALAADEEQDFARQHVAVLLSGMRHHHRHLVLAREDEMENFHAVARRAAGDAMPVIAAALVLDVTRALGAAIDLDLGPGLLLAFAEQILEPKAERRANLNEIGDRA
jgi:hypothetical protein